MSLGRGFHVVTCIFVRLLSECSFETMPFKQKIHINTREMSAFENVGIYLFK